METFTSCASVATAWRMGHFRLNTHRAQQGSQGGRTGTASGNPGLDSDAHEARVQVLWPPNPGAA
jgi:hypothetical protein